MNVLLVDCDRVAYVVQGTICSSINIAEWLEQKELKWN